MALTAYMSVKGQKQGTIKGSATQKGRENKIAVHEFHHEVLSPRDASSGLPTGKRQHKPIAITKEIDLASIPLMVALTTNENITEILIDFFSTSPEGIEQAYYRIKLTNANVAHI